MFKPGQLVKHRKPIKWPATHFPALLAGDRSNDWYTDPQGRVFFAGRVEIAYEDVGLCIDNGGGGRTMTVLFGEHLVDINVRDMESCDV